MIVNYIYIYIYKYIYDILEFEKNKNLLAELIEQRENRERIKEAKDKVKMRFNLVATRQIKLPNSFPEAHRACKICRSNNISHKHHARDSVFFPPTSFQDYAHAHTVFDMTDKEVHNIIAAEERNIDKRLEIVTMPPTFLKRKTILSPEKQSSLPKSVKNTGIRSISHMNSIPHVSFR